MKKITIKPIDKNKLALNQRKFTTSEIGRGIGVHSSDKGKGSYRRKKNGAKKNFINNEV